MLGIILSTVAFGLFGMLVAIIAIDVRTNKLRDRIDELERILDVEHIDPE